MERLEVAEWREALDNGDAGARADAVVRSRPVPNRLLVALLDADTTTWKARQLLERKHTRHGRPRTASVPR